MIRIEINQNLLDYSVNFRKNLFLTRKRNFSKPKSGLKNLKKTFKTKAQLAIIDKIILDYEKLVEATPQKLLRFVNYYNKHYIDAFLKNNKATKFSEAILKAMRYDALRDKEGIEIFSFLKIKTCIYCNSQLTVTIEGESKKKAAKFEFDHFYPKSKYPFLATSFFNLIPSCSNCNKTKGNKTFTKKTLFYLYTENKNELEQYAFKLDPKSQVDYWLTKDTNSIKFSFIDISGAESSMSKKHNKLFSIQSIYNTQTDIIEELFHIHEAYTKANQKSMTKNLEALFPDEAFIKRLLIGTYIEKNEIHKRPLTKFRQDIARDLGLI